MSEELRSKAARGGWIMMIGILASRMLGILRDTLMVSEFGRTVQTDAYRLAFQVPDLIFFLLSSGALSSAFIPVFSEYYHNDRKSEAWKIFSSVLNIAFTFLTIIIGIAWYFAEELATLTAPGKTHDLIPLIASMSRILLPAQLAFVVGGLFFGTLYARNHFKAPSLAPNIYNIGIISGILIFSHWVEPSIMGLAWGALLGAYVGNVIIPIGIVMRSGWEYSFKFNVSHPGVKKVFKLMLPVVLGLSLPSVYGMIMQGFGSYFPNGVNTSLDLANKLIHVPLGVFGQSMAIGAFPILSRHFSQKRMDLFSDQLSDTLGRIIYLTIPISLLMIVIPKDIVRVLLEYGKFSSSDTQSVAECLQFFAIGVGAWCLQPVLMRAYYAMHLSWKPILFGTMTTIIFYLLAFSLIQTSLGYLGLPLAGAMVPYVLIIWMINSLKKDIVEFDVKKILSTFVLSIICAIGMGFIVWVLSCLMPEKTSLYKNLYAGFRFFMLSGLGLIIYVILTRVFKVPESKITDCLFKKYF